MIEHPFLNFKDLSDDELLNKTSEIFKKLNGASMWGSSQGIIDQFHWMLEMIEEEKMERMAKANFEALKNIFPETVESDPDFKKDKVVEEAKEKAAKSKPTGPRTFPAPVFTKEYTEGKDPKDAK